jgi:SAM-dependent methyltransferase
MSSTSPSQSEYYQQHRLHPNRIDAKDPAVLDRYRAGRKHLYQDLLHLPMRWLKDREALEVGCGTGESACVLARYGARLTLIDADPTVMGPLERLFAETNLQHRIRRKFTGTLEAFEDEQRFDLVTAEGFLFTLPERNDALRKLCRLVAPEGFGILSFPDRFGSFLEFVKKAVFWRGCQLREIRDVHGPEALEVARALLETGHAALPSARPFEVWWTDCIASPFLNYDQCWDYDDILSLLDQEGCRYHASTPRLYEPPHLAWHKTVPSDREQYETLRRSYAARRFDFLLGSPLALREDSPGPAAASRVIRSILQGLSGYFRSLTQPIPPLSFAPAARALREAGADHPLIEEMQRFFELLPTPSWKTLHRGYGKLPLLTRSWGCSYHYLCFTNSLGA